MRSWDWTRRPRWRQPEADLVLMTICFWPRPPTLLGLGIKAAWPPLGAQRKLIEEDAPERGMNYEIRHDGRTEGLGHRTGDLAIRRGWLGLGYRARSRRGNADSTSGAGVGNQLFRYCGGVRQRAVGGDTKPKPRWELHFVAMAKAWQFSSSVRRLWPVKGFGSDVSIHPYGDLNLRKTRSSSLGPGLLFRGIRWL